MAKLIFGCGYLGERVGRRWLDAGETVHAVTRSERRAEELERAGYRAIVADVTDPATLTNLPAAETVLFAVGFDRSAGQPIEQVYIDGLRNVLDRLPPAAGHLIYISSTGVYSQDDGGWVDEDSPCKPKRPGGKACLAAERLLAAHELGRRATILRMAGLYGPGRVPRKHDILSETPIPSPGDGYLNLIHIEDAADVVLLVESRRGATRVYLVSDGAPVLRRDYYAEIARQLDAPAPRYVASEETGQTPGRGAADKRISNRRLTSEFAVRLRYPSYREGLSAILPQEP
ncbi:MAG: SDR family oxidoreductase [Pirellulales bacterium]